jgi:hypothetical protein
MPWIAIRQKGAFLSPEMEYVWNRMEERKE